MSHWLRKRKGVGSAPLWLVRHDHIRLLVLLQAVADALQDDHDTPVQGLEVRLPQHGRYRILLQGLTHRLRQRFGTVVESKIGGGVEGSMLELVQRDRKEGCWLTLEEPREWIPGWGSTAAREPKWSARHGRAFQSHGHGPSAAGMCHCQIFCNQMEVFIDTIKVMLLFWVFIEWKIIIYSTHKFNCSNIVSGGRLTALSMRVAIEMKYLFVLLKYNDFVERLIKSCTFRIM